jgi:hypothetical protein
MTGNPYNQADDFMAGFAPTLQLLQQGRAQRDAIARADRQEARLEDALAMEREDRARRIRLEDENRVISAEQRARQNRFDDVRLEAVQRDLAAAETPEEAKARRADEASARRQSLTIGRLQLDQTQQEILDARATKAQKDALPVIHEIGALLSRDPDTVTDADVGRFAEAWKAFGVDFGTLMSPEYAAAEETLKRAVAEGKLTDRSTLPAWGVVFKDRLNRTSGEVLDQPVQRPDGRGGTVTLPKGTTIMDRDLVGVRAAPGGGVYGIVRVGYRTPDGTEGAYIAPIDQSRTAGANGDPMVISADEAIRQLVGRAKAREMLVSDPKIKSRVSAFLTARDQGGASAKSSAQIQYLQYVADTVFDGDQKAAFNAIRGGNTRQIAASMAGKMVEMQKNAPRAQRKSYEQLYQEALTMVQNAAASSGSGDSGAQGGGADVADMAGAPSGDFVEGQIYEDAQGNQAVYRNGQFEPVE